MTTFFENKAEILAELWQEHRDNKDFKDFIKFNDLGLPLAYAVANGIAERNQVLDQFIEETFRLLLIGLGIKDDLGFEVLDDVLSAPTGD